MHRSLVLYFFLLICLEVIKGKPLQQDRCCLKDSAKTPVALSPRKPKNMAFIIGAQKSGTTFLFDELVKRHPHIKSREIKEPGRINDEKEAHYFNMLPLPNAERYIQAFENAANTQNTTLTFIDGTPDYMHTPSAACRIAGAFPEAKLIVLLRDPVARALSHWNMFRVFGGKKGFEEEVGDELAMMRKKGCSFELPPTLAGSISSSPSADAVELANEVQWKRDKRIPSYNACFRCTFGRCGTLKRSEEGSVSCVLDEFPLLGYVRRGLYAYQLEWWMKFFSEDQFLILNQEQMEKDPEFVIKKAITFLGQDPNLLAPPEDLDASNLISGRGSSVVKGFHKKNASGWSLPMRDKNATQVYARAIEDLYRYFAHPNQELYALLKTLKVAANGWTGEFPKEPKNKSGTEDNDEDE
ncbi:hypothetical protein CEUSTIGMA_g13787.t1 [Chlamydomonas eustigma]|uniref:Sulfotransferase n=1 Tax=Chlamydomonas eustigma TaxID=1157962 RepID=A0A250XTJ7_9CHLO|nr:hypothetical protein CEUSTIGMA_g13787.t1 [Chlamydomonas eustigma]|eukprot:GAX86375.1 hypothetical protein CEUSTIGMA_g13787.t1 [Chlamydomonas eustigma]